RASLTQIATLLRDASPAVRQAGVLAAGLRLTVPPSDFEPPPELPLTYTSAHAYFTLNYAEEPPPIDPRSLTPIRRLTTAEWWKAIKPGSEYVALADFLVAMLNDSSEVVQSQAAYYLSLLRDERIERLLRDRHERQLRRRLVSRRDVLEVWAVGPFEDGGPE